MEDSDCNDVLGLELNRLFFALGTETSKRKLVEFARALLEAERQQQSFGNDRLSQSAADAN
jgi:hypothetical protein